MRLTGSKIAADISGRSGRAARPRIRFAPWLAAVFQLVDCVLRHAQLRSAPFRMPPRLGWTTRCMQDSGRSPLQEADQRTACRQGCRQSVQANMQRKQGKTLCLAAAVQPGVECTPPRPSGRFADLRGCCVVFDLAACLPNAPDGAMPTAASHVRLRPPLVPRRSAILAVACPKTRCAVATQRDEEP